MKFSYFKYFAIAFLVALGLCSPMKASAKIKLNKTSVKLYVGKKAKLKLKGAKAKKVKWTSKAKKKVSVTKKGVIKAKKPGTVKIIAKYKKKKYTCKVKTGNYATGITLSSANVVSLEQDGYSQISAKVNGTKVLYTGFTYKTSDEKIVTVSSSGQLHGLSQGEAAVTVTTKACNKKGVKFSAVVNVYVSGTKVKVDQVDMPKSSATVTEIYTEGKAETVDVKLKACMEVLGTNSTGSVLKARLLVKDNNKTYTVYLLDKSYTGTIGLNIYGTDLYSSRTLSDLISLITKSKNASYTKTDASGNKLLYLEDNLGNARVSNYKDNALTGEKIEFTLYETDSIVSKYACIVVDGDVRDVVTVK
ncbi:MAG: Ig-like domain-containing protein [Lachnospiraceae bacterium]|nr:Ig-like domain-containing protein [Lachnospiraceae bacterium]